MSFKFNLLREKKKKYFFLFEINFIYVVNKTVFAQWVTEKLFK